MKTTVAKIFTFSTSSLLLFLAMGNSARALEASCTAEGVTGGILPASMQVNCNGTYGYIDNGTRAKSITFSYITKDGKTGTATLNNPRLPARNYFDASDSAEALAVIRQQLKPGQVLADVAMQSMSFDPLPKQYADPYEKTVTKGGNYSGDAAVHCTWRYVPALMTAKNCGAPICIGVVDCDGGSIQTDATCYPKNGSCGEATNCANQTNDIKLVDAPFSGVTESQVSFDPNGSGSSAQ